MSRLSSLVMNAGPRLVLASPAHPLVSGRWATLHFTGRRTGRRYRLPVAYVAQGGIVPSNEGGRIVISTDSAWWHNLVDGEPFRVRLRGRRRQATATRLVGDEALDALRQLVQLPGYAKAAGIQKVNGTVEADELVRAAEERVVLSIDIEARK